MTLHLGFLASHRGNGVRTIFDEISKGSLDAVIKVIISNNPTSEILQFAERENLCSYCVNEKNEENVEQRMIELIEDHSVNILLLAGYLKKVGSNVISTLSGKILNIHPSLLPKYGGQGMYGIKVHEAVILSKDTESGATVHVIDEEYDKGRILAQYKVPRYINDTSDTLAERVSQIEKILYPQVLRDIKKGIIEL